LYFQGFLVSLADPTASSVPRVDFHVGGRSLIKSVTRSVCHLTCRCCKDKHSPRGRART